MSLVTLLALQDDQIEVVTEALRRWCDTQKLEIDSERGRVAMQAAISLALADRWEPECFEARLASQMGPPQSEA